MCSARPSSRGRPQIVNRPSVVKATGVFGSTRDGSFTTGTSTWKVHCFGSVFLFVAHCPKCSVFVSSLSTRTLLSDTEQVARPSRFASSTVNVQPTAELTAVMRSPICESNTAVKALFPTSGSTANCVAAATRLTATSAANRISAAFGCPAMSPPGDLDADSFGSAFGYSGPPGVSDLLNPERQGPTAVGDGNCRGPVTFDGAARMNSSSGDEPRHCALPSAAARWAG